MIKDNAIMILVLTGASHTGKTRLAQKLLEKLHYPYLSIDHLKMGLIRSGNTSLTPMDDDKLTAYLWPIVKEMIKTAIENEQNLIVEGCYIPFDWRKDFSKVYEKNIRFICLAMSDQYIERNFDRIAETESCIEKRKATSLSKEMIKSDNREYIEGFRLAGEQVYVIDDNYEKEIERIIKTI